MFIAYFMLCQLFSIFVDEHMENIADISEKPHMVNLPRFLDPRGNLSVIEQMKEAPFKINRTYWVYDVPGGDGREGHAYRKNCEMIVALSGSFEVATESGAEETVYQLNRCYQALYVPAGTWRELRNFSTNSVALVLASEPYCEEDYLLTRAEYQQFLAEKGERTND